MNTIYSIYIGRKPNGKWKVGCDKDYPHRPKEQKMKIYTCIETHDCVYKASDREIELQIKYFGKRDSNASYHEMVKRAQLAWKRNTGSTHSEETKVKMSNSHKGKIFSEETKLKLSKARTGKVHSEESNLKLSNSKKGVHAGSKSGMAKLTEADVLEIRSKYIPRVYTHQKLADEYGVDGTSIFNIIKRLTWAHI